MSTEPSPPTAERAEDHRAATAVVAAHSLKHVYQQGYYVVLPELYQAFGLNPVTAGLMDLVRRSVGGVGSMAGGVLLDRYRDRRVHVLYASLVVMGLGYLLLGLAPSYGAILVAVAMAGTAGSLWHPAALGLLGSAYPHRRGFVLAIHRSSGSVGDVVGPLLVGALLVTVAWQTVLFGALPIAVVVAGALWLVVRRAPNLGVSDEVFEKRRIGELGRTLASVVRDRDLLRLMVVSGLNGLGQGSLVMWLSLYLRETQGMSSVGIGVHVALVTGFGIVAGPLIGGLSDRVGRRPVIVGVLVAKTLIALGMALVGSGWMFTVLVAMMGAFLYGAGALLQASALDLTEGRRVEGSMIGLMWGVNAAFVGASPLLVGFIIQATAFIAVFWYVATTNLLATLVATSLPNLEERASAGR